MSPIGSVIADERGLWIVTGYLGGRRSLVRAGSLAHRIIASCSGDVMLRSSLAAAKLPVPKA